MRHRLPLMLLVALSLSACSWGIKLNDAGRQVRTAWNGDVSGCRDLGKVTVSVMDHLGPIDRNNITVRDELEVMARNEAATMNADTVKPLGDPENGQQSWEAYRCGAAGATAQKKAASQNKAGSAEPPRSGQAQTYPMGSSSSNGGG